MSSLYILQFSVLKLNCIKPYLKFQDGALETKKQQEKELFCLQIFTTLKKWNETGKSANFFKQILEMAWIRKQLFDVKQALFVVFRLGSF